MSEFAYEDYDYMNHNYDRNDSIKLYNLSNLETEALEIILITILSIAGLTLLCVINYTLYTIFYNNDLFSRYKRKLEMKKIGEINHELVEDEKDSEENKKKVIEMNIYIDDGNRDDTAKSESTEQQTEQQIEQSTNRIDDNGGGENRNSNE